MRYRSPNKTASVSMWREMAVRWTGGSLTKQVAEHDCRQDPGTLLEVEVVVLDGIVVPGGVLQSVHQDDKAETESDEESESYGAIFANRFPLFTQKEEHS